MHTATNPRLEVAVPRPTRQPAAAPEHLAKLVHQLGVPTVVGFGAAIRQDVLDMPAPVVADALGYHHVATTSPATYAGATWSRYAPGDHSQPNFTANSRQLNTRAHQSATLHARRGSTIETE